ncbi:MAG: hypothetical protein IJS54_00910 [Desulfovibrio sp.]|nr:hypothetical protein [Desulfovibrio sp.]
MALEDYKVGFRTIGYSNPEQNFRLDVNIWYPTTKNPRELTYTPWTILAAREAKVANGRFPLLILSHPSPGTRFSYHDTCALLAKKGFIVAAPTHAEDCMDNMRLIFTWEQLRTRVQDIKRLIDLLPNHKDIGTSIDTSKIGVIGAGAGGTAALLLGGAKPNCISWPDYCTKAGKKDVYCNPWAREKINTICKEFPLRKSLADKRISAIALLSPSFGMLFSPSSFKTFPTPLLILSLGNDTVNNHLFHADAISGYVREQSRTLWLPTADLGALMAPCPESLARELQELCRSVTPKQRQTIHKRMWEHLALFFADELKNKETPSPKH